MDNTVRISISQILGSKNAITRSAGQNVFLAFQRELAESSNEILFDFQGIEKLTSGFCHAAIGQVFLSHPEMTASQVKFKGLSNPVWNTMIDEVIELATNQSQRESHQNLLSELMDA